MAKPIKETPVLHGKSAREFEKQFKANEKCKVPESDYNRAKQAFESVRPYTRSDTRSDAYRL